MKSRTLMLSSLGILVEVACAAAVLAAGYALCLAATFTQWF